MVRSLLAETSENGGFPEPPATEPIRVIAARHDVCGTDTRVRLPGSVPARAVRRLSCSRCAQPFTAQAVEDRGLEEVEQAADSRQRTMPRLRAASMIRALKPRLAKPTIELRLAVLNPSSRTWRAAGVPLAAVAVVGGLLLIQGGGSEPQPTAFAAEPAAAAASDSSASGAVTGGAGNGDGNGRLAATAEAQLVSGSAYSLALPPGWKQTQPLGGATFAAVAADGGADAQLWISEDASLDYPAFVRQSLQQLEVLAGSARIVARVPAPSAEATIVTLAADAPPDTPSYEVTLRVSGPYRYYLATSVQPGASRAAVSGSELLSGSFTPEGPA